MQRADSAVPQQPPRSSSRQQRVRVLSGWKINGQSCTRTLFTLDAFLQGDLAVTELKAKRRLACIQDLNPCLQMARFERAAVFKPSPLPLLKRHIPMQDAAPETLYVGCSCSILVPPQLLDMSLATGLNKHLFRYTLYRGFR